MVNYVPEGTRTLTPHLVVKGAARAIAFYEKALGARERVRMPAPGGTIAHAELQLGDSLFYLADEFPNSPLTAPQQQKGSSVGMHVYVADCDALIQRAVSAGATIVMPAMDMFWGDRYGQVRDPFGHIWSIATHKEDLSPEEMGRRGAEAMAQMSAGEPPLKPARKPAAKPAAKAKKAAPGRARRR